MEVGEPIDDNLIDHTFEELSQSQRLACAQLASTPLLHGFDSSQEDRNVNARKKKQVAARTAPEPKGERSGSPKKNSVILKLLRDIAKAPSIIRRNCFEHTVLDEVDTIPAKIELQEVGDWLQASAQVYGYRVENTFTDAYSTHCSLLPALGNMGNEAEGEGKRNRAERKAQQLAAQQTANLEKLHDVQIDAAEDGEEEPDFFAAGSSKDEDDEEEEQGFDYDKITFSDKLYHDVIEKECTRREEALAAKRGLNPYLIEDETKYRMQPALLLNNEYYQAATSRYKEHNAAGLLTYNAKVTHNGRIIMLHKHMNDWNDTVATDKTLPNVDFSRAIGGLVENAMAERPKVLKNELFADEDCVEQLSGLALRGGLAEMEKNARQAALQREEREIFEMEFTSSQSGKENVPAEEERPKDPSPSTSQATPEEHEEDLLVSAVPVAQAENVSEELERMAARMAEIEKVLSDDIIPDGPSLTTTALPSYFAHILQTKIVDEDGVWNRGAQAEELQADPRDIHEDLFHMESYGIDDDLRELDFVWNAQLVRKRVDRTVVQQSNFDDEATDCGASSMWSQPHPRRLELPRGDYEFMAEPDEYEIGVPVDEYSLMVEGDQPMARVVDNASDDGGAASIAVLPEGGLEDAEPDEMEGPIRIDLPEGNESDSLDMDQGFGDVDDLPSARAAQKVRLLDDDDDEGEGEGGGVQQAIDRAMATSSDSSTAMPSQMVTKIGKVDDSHWKLAASHPDNQKEKKERKKREGKVEKQMAKAEADYFSQSAGGIVSRDARPQRQCRFAMVDDANELIRDEDAVLQRRSAVSAVPQEAYEFDMFFRPFIINTELFGKFRIDNVPERRIEVDGDTREGPSVEQEDEVDPTKRKRRPSAYSRLLEAAKEASDQDTYLAFLNTFRDYAVTDRREAVLEERRLERLSQRRSAAHAAGIENEEDLDDDMGGTGNDTFGDYIPPADEDMNEGFPRPRTPEQIAESEAKSVVASSHGYGMRLYDNDYNEEEDAATASIMGKRYNLKQIKLDAVAMKSALSDVLTNPMMVPERLNETLSHFSKLPPVTTQTPPSVDDFEQTMHEVPDALEMSRALFAPPQETKQPDITMMYREASPTRIGESEEDRMKNYFNRSQEITMLEPRGHHTLRSTFTCLPARMPNGKNEEVTVASTIAMMLHLANENNLILDQMQPEAGSGDELDDFNAWMNDFEVLPENSQVDEDDRHNGSTLGEVSAANILVSLGRMPISGEEVVNEISRQQRIEKEQEGEASRVQKSVEVMASVPRSPPASPPSASASAIKRTPASPRRKPQAVRQEEEEEEDGRDGSEESEGEEGEKGTRRAVKRTSPRKAAQHKKIVMDTDDSDASPSPAPKRTRAAPASSAPASASTRKKAAGAAPPPAAEKVPVVNEEVVTLGDSSSSLLESDSDVELLSN